MNLDNLLKEKEVTPTLQAEKPETVKKDEIVTLLASDLQKLEIELEKMQKLYKKFKDEDIKTEIIEMQAQIEKINLQLKPVRDFEQEVIEVETSIVEYRKFYSKTLNQNIKVDDANGCVQLESGAIYTFRELAELKDIPEPEINISKLNDFKIFKGEFSNVYQERIPKTIIKHKYDLVEDENA